MALQAMPYRSDLYNLDQGFHGMSLSSPNFVPLTDYPPRSGYFAPSYTSSYTYSQPTITTYPAYAFTAQAPPPFTAEPTSPYASMPANHQGMLMQQPLLHQPFLPEPQPAPSTPASAPLPTLLPASGPSLPSSPSVSSPTDSKISIHSPVQSKSKLNPKSKSAAKHHSHKRSYSKSSHGNQPSGPLPADDQIIVKRDAQGVKWITFTYTLSRIPTIFTIRTDTHTIPLSSLTHQFKDQNCSYPKAYRRIVNGERYESVRLKYEEECNRLGWALAELNPELRGRKGLIQRAVDSVRNCDEDFEKRSRRVRRNNKKHAREEREERGSIGSNASLHHVGEDSSTAARGASTHGLEEYPVFAAMGGYARYGIKIED